MGAGAEGQAEAGASHASAVPAGWRHGDREQVAVVSFSHAIQHAYVAVLGIVYPFALADFHVSYAVLGVILSVAGIVGGLLQGLAGLVKKYSARVLLGCQNSGMALASVLGALSPGMVAFSAARIFGTLVNWPQHPVGSAHLVDRVPHRRGLVLSAHTTGGNVGTLVAPIAASAAIAAFSWRWALAGAGMVMALGSIVTWTRVRPGHDSAAGHGSAAGHDSSAGHGSAAERSVPARSQVSVRSALRRRKAVAVLAAGMIAGAGRGLGVLTTYVPAYLRDGLHERALTIGVLVTVVSIGAVFGPMVFGQISDRAGRRPVLYTLYAFGAAALAGFVLVGSNLLLLGLAGLCVGVFSYSEQPVRQALFSDAMDGVPARAAFGAYFAISQSFGALWIALIGLLVTDVGFHVAFFVMASSFVAAGAVIAVFARDPTASQARPEVTAG